MIMETRCYQKTLNFDDARNTFCVPLEHKSSKKKFQTKVLAENKKKHNPGQMLDQDRPEKNSTKC